MSSSCNIVTKCMLSNTVINYQTQWGQVTHIWGSQLDRHLVEIMACCLFGTSPWSEPVLNCCHLDPKEHIFYGISFTYQTCSINKMHLKMLSAKWWSFSVGLNVLDSTCPCHTLCDHTGAHAFTTCLTIFFLYFPPLEMTLLYLTMKPKMSFMNLILVVR